MVNVEITTPTRGPRTPTQVTFRWTKENVEKLKVIAKEHGYKEYTGFIKDILEKLID